MRVDNWDDLKNKGFKITKRGNYRDTINKLTYYKKICIKCKEHFLASRQSLKYCSPECSGSKQFTYEQVKKYIESFGYELISLEYINVGEKITVKCPKGHIYDVTYNHFRRGRRCYICSGHKKHTYEYIKEYIEKEGYELLSKEYNNAFDILNLKCPKGHRVLIRWNDFQQGHRCPKCVGIISKGEIEVYELVKSLISEEVINNDRTQITNPLTGYKLELDIWIPSLNKAIEYNGEHWHSKPEAIIRDNEKVRQCEEKNIDLLTVWEYDWKNNKDNCINTIKEWL